MEIDTNLAIPLKSHVVHSELIDRSTSTNDYPDEEDTTTNSVFITIEVLVNKLPALLVTAPKEESWTGCE